MNQAVFLIADPELSGMFFGEAVHDSRGQSVQRRESVPVEDGDAAQRRYEDSAGTVFEQCSDPVVGQAVASPVNRRTSVPPSAQPIRRADPYAFVSRTEDRGREVGQHVLSTGEGRDRQLSKPIQSLGRR